MKSKVLTVLLSAVIAIALWAYVVTVEKPESENTYRNVPVVLEGVDILQERGLMITSNPQTTVTVKLTGKRKELNNLKSSDISAAVDLSRVYEAGEKNLSYTVYAPGVNNFEVVSRHPDGIVLTVTEWASKEIPIELDYVGKVPEGYYVDRQNATVDYEKLNINGPKDIISQIEKAVVTINLDDQTQTIAESVKYSLCNGEGIPIEDVSTVRTDVGELRLTVSIQQMKELTLEYTVVEGGGLKATDVTVTADYETVTVSGSAAALEGLEKIDLGEVDLGAITESTELILPIELPEGVLNRSGFTVVHLNVQVPELETRDYTVTKFRVDNVPQGCTSQIYTQVLVVKLRGRRPVLDRILPEHITAVVDVIGEGTGVFSLPAEFEIEGFGGTENLGAVDKYSITVRISDGAEEATTPAETKPQ